ncbi:trans-resveratrol di-O-methyltransferase-like [Typha angustifolia]|uniref:trans-resveratrol di-O-methyltransferase-like n=1 Tax=Typha angustifolia TaxID=59011 RepID=UPI003C2ACEC4
MELMTKAKNFESHDLLQAQEQLWNHIFLYLKSMSLKCAVELGIPDVIHNHGGSIAHPELLAALSLPPSRSPHLRRLMRMLTHSGFFATRRSPGSGDEEEEEEDVYLLTPLSYLLVNDNNNSSLSPFVLAVLDPYIVEPSYSMSSWFRSCERTPFQMVNGWGFWDMAGRDGKLNRIFNDGMASDGRFVMDVVVKEHGDVFQGVTSLVDVGGGIGAAARAIAEAFEIRCSVLDLPHVVGNIAADGVVEFVAGNMFDRIPPADAVLLKWILHDWDDEECVKILRRCKEAIPAREAGGKVIVIDMVVDLEKPNEVELLFDLLMMMISGSFERNEKEWRKIIWEAGFSDYKIIPVLGVRSIIELYP